MFYLYLITSVILGYLIYYKIIKPSKYFEENGILHEPTWPVIGDMGPAVTRTKHIMDIVLDVYKKFPDARYVGFMQFTRPFLMIRDLELIKQIGVKDFDSFHDHYVFANTDMDPLVSKSLIALNGEEWRQMRATLSPAFTGSKMRNMYQLMAECAQNFVNHFKGKEKVAVDMKNILSKFATDVIATTAFGIQIDSMQDPNNSFFKMGNQLSNTNFIRFLKVLLLQFSPKLAKIIGIEVFPKDISEFFRTIVKDNIAKRENQGIVRPDMIHLLMEARKGQLKHETNQEEVEGFATVEESHIGKSNTKMKLTDDHMVAQAMIFFFAGFETVSTSSCFMAHELAINPDIQKKLQEEIDQVKQQYKETVPYEVLQSMKYLDQVICETLRKWAPAFQTDRICTNIDYTIPAQSPKENTVLLQKGSSILIPVLGIHRDPQYYPDPECFNPERFNDENKSKIVPGSYMPFGVGPRNCIGSRFALLEIKTLFVTLLYKFDLVPVNETEIPLKISAKKLGLQPERGFKLGFKPRKQIY